MRFLVLLILFFVSFVKKLLDYKVEPGHTLIMVSFLRGGWY